MTFQWPWAKVREVECIDGSKRTIHKNIDEACPLFISGFKLDVTTDIRGADDLSGKMDAKYERDVKGFLFQLNEQNQSLMLCFRTVYLVYSTNPCGNDGFFQREIEKLLDEQRKISTLKIKIAALIQLASTAHENSGQLNAIYEEISRILGGTSVAPVAALEINEVRAIAERMLAGEKK